MKRHAHPDHEYESEFEVWLRGYRRKLMIKRALFWLAYLAIMTLGVALFIKGLGSL